jgi:hypothetical protein
MRRSRNRAPQAVLFALEAEAASARGGFACLFSTADEYEAALISQRRAQGRYHRRRSPWPILVFIASAIMLLGAVLITR